MTRDELLKRKMDARAERDALLQRAGMALGIETECDQRLAEMDVPPLPTENTPPEKVTPIRKRAPDDPRS